MASRASFVAAGRDLLTTPVAITAFGSNFPTVSLGDDAVLKIIDPVTGKPSFPLGGDSFPMASGVKVEVIPIVTGNSTTL